MEVSGCSNDGDFGHRGARGACGGVSPCLERVRSRRVDARRVNARVEKTWPSAAACGRRAIAFETRHRGLTVLRVPVSTPSIAIQPHQTPHVCRGAHVAAPHGRDAPHAADHRRRRLRERKVRRRSSTPKYPSADRQRARGRRRERNRDVSRHAPVTTDTSGRVYDWRARRRREAVPARLEFRRTTLPDREGRRFAR